MWSNWWRRRRAQQLVWDRSLQHSLIAQLPTLAALPPSDHQRLAELTAEFLVDKRFFGAHGLTLEPRHLITIATLACWPILRLGYDALRGWRELIVYPGDFSSQREVAEPIGDLELVHEYTEALSGESWDRGPLVLGWEAICEDLQHPEDGVSVVIHEIAHKLDARTGQTDGLPLLPRPMSVSDWSQTMSSAFAGFRATVERADPGEQAMLDPYAAESPAEFFAVCSEAYCLRPDLLRGSLPSVYALLDQYYGLVPERATT